ncbi:SWIM zinc finger family protein [Paenibacillus whitsoniae]|uniref:SWIM zinc finger family protein n=1 Tax=Paenibacillus whitsoniae TaxID=2496558 RepID=A0A3S0A2P8_9BACL|nr:SWIM zinc finger family protein [Paenibacillus whitsoniae]RTE08168.1 SWIM zinc finger family protein [Paenibacillus whitsoniae]
MMGSRMKLTPQELQVLLEQVQQSFSYDVLMKGYEAYTQRCVTYLQITTASRVIAGYSSNGTPYEVELDIDFLNISTCTCGGAGLCEHLAAVFFEVYQIGTKQSDSLMRNFERAERERRALVEDTARREAFKRRKQEEMEKERLHKEQQQSAVKLVPARVPLPSGDAPKSPPIRPSKQLYETDTVQDWHDFWAKKYGFKPNSAIDFPEVFILVSQICNQARTWTELQRQLLDLHANLFALRKISDHVDNFTHWWSSSQKKICLETVENCLEEIGSMLEEIDWDAVQKMHPDRIDQTLKWLSSNFFTEESRCPCSLPLYALCGQHIGRIGQRLEKEAARLEKEIADRKGAQQPVFALHARACLYWLEADDSAATACLERLEDLQRLEIWGLLELATFLWREEQWERLVFWLRWLILVFSNEAIVVDEEEFEDYMDLWWDVFENKQISEEQWGETLSALLPRSVGAYSEFLLERKSYRRWVDAMIVCRVHPLYLDGTEIRTVKKSNPALLLPLYHITVDHCLRSKKQDMYTDVVDMLQLIKQIYTDLNQLGQWESYFAHLSKTFSRLRRFQQLLKEEGLR